MEPIKVMCVNVPKEWRVYKSFFGYNHPEVLDECEVKKKVVHPIKGNPMYVLLRYPSNISFAAKHFATLPGLSADEINELVKEGIIK